MANGLNHDNEMVTFILHMTLNAGRDVEEAQNWTKTRSAPYTHGLNEEKTIRYEWFFSEDGQSATLIEQFQNSAGAVTRVNNLVASPIVAEWTERFQVTDFHVLGKVDDEAKALLRQFEATFMRFQSGFFNSF